MNVHHELSSGIFLVNQATANILNPYLFAVKTNPGSLSQIPKHDRTGASIAFSSQQKIFTADIYDINWSPEEIQEPTIFILDIVGPILKYNNWWNYGMMNMANWLKMADNHPNIFAHVLRIDSGGGNGYASEFMVGCLKDLKKPVFAICDGMLASAAYEIAAAAVHVRAALPSNYIGSIGTYIPFWDDSKRMESLGIVDVQIYARKSKDKNAEYRDAVKGDFAKMQALADQYNEFFLDSITNNRGEKLGPESEWGTGKMFFGQEAQDIGLIDDIGSFDDYLQKIYDEFKPN